MDNANESLKEYIRKHSKFIAALSAVIVAFLLVLSCTYFDAMENLQGWFEQGGLLFALCCMLYVMPPYVSFVAIAAIPFIYITRQQFEKRQIPILAVAAIISACMVTSQSLVHTHTYGTLFGTWLNGLLTILSFIGIWAFVFFLLRPAFYAVKKFADGWFVATPQDIPYEPPAEELPAEDNAVSVAAESEENKSEETAESPYVPAVPEKADVLSARPQAVSRQAEEAAPAFEPSKGWHLKPYYYAIIFCIFVICWSVYVIGFAPGYINIDGSRQLGIWIGRLEVSNGSPILTTIVYGFLFSIGRVIGGDPAGLFAVVLFQTLLMGLIFTFEVKIFEKLQAPKWAIITMIFMVAVSPVIGAFCAFVAMDVLHSVCFSAYVCLVILYVKNPTKFVRSIPWMAALIAAAMLTSLTRHNAFYAVILSLPFLALFQPGIRAKLKTLVPFVIALLLVPVVVEGCLAAMGGQNNVSSASVMSIPVQQSARYAIEHPDDYEDWEYEAIDNLLRMEDLGERYQYWLQDPVGFESNPDASREEYMKAWLSQGLRHPLTYLDALGEMTYGWWSLQTTIPYDLEGNRIGQAVPVNIETGEEMFDFGYWSSYSTRTNVNRFAETLEQLPFARYLLQGGFYTWMSLIMFALLVFAKNPRYIIILVPSLVILLTLFFGPRDNTLRYFLDVICSFPVVLWGAVYFVRSRSGVRQPGGQCEAMAEGCV